MNSIVISLLLSLAIVINAQSIYLNQIPADPIFRTQVELRLNRLRTYLKQFSLKSSYQELYLRAKLCEIYLEELTSQTLKDYENMLDGQANQIDGAENIVLGSKNNVKGQKNWVFSTNYNGEGDRNLIIDNWKIQLDKIEALRSNPNVAITKW